MTFQIRLSAFVLAAMFVFMAMPLPVNAQSPMPYGLWRGERSSDHILVRSNGVCQANGSVNVVGRCEWIPSYRGGILNIVYRMPLAPGRVGWSVMWADQNTIVLNGVENFRRRPVTSY